MRIADPKPGYCSVCFGFDPEVQFVDAGSDFDGRPVLDPETGEIAKLPWLAGSQPSHDDLMVCFPCVRRMADLAAHKPDAEARLLREIHRLEKELRFAREYARGLEATLKTRPAEMDPPAPRRRVPQPA